VSHAAARRAARTALVLVALAIALAIGAVLGVAASPSTADAVQAPAVEVAPAVEAPALDEDPFLLALLGDAGLPENAEELLLAADRVCEGVTAEVPVVVMADTVAAEFSVDDEQAREFVNLAATIRCSAA
jgi:hypothetical protein